MIVSWMMYATAIGALVALSAWAAELAMRQRRGATRFGWAAALVVSIVWPLAAFAVQRWSPALRAVRLMPFTIGAESLGAGRAAAVISGAVLVERALLGLWIAASALLLWRLIYGLIALQRTRASWKPSQVDGMAVHLSENVGPAVVGLRRMDVVLPEWILSLDASLREIVLRHEDEHRRAGDPYLLFGAAVATVLMPWNLAVWFQARRLRLAVEMDCDARVLRAHPVPERYGMLILTIAQRRSTAPARFAPMLSEPATNLERRILAMRNRTAQAARSMTFAGAFAALAFLALACSLDSDMPSDPQTNVSSKVIAVAGPKPVSANQTYFEFQVEKSATPMPGNRGPRYPDMLRSAHVEGEVLAQFVLRADGTPDMSTFKVLKSNHDLFTNAVKQSLPAMKFSPAEVGGKKVKQLVQMPFQFSLTK
jgi:TonB family protein